MENKKLFKDLIISECIFSILMIQILFFYQTGVKGYEGDQSFALMELLALLFVIFYYVNLYYLYK
jgi:hypothetical protein